MIETVRPPSMPSTLISNHDTSFYPTLPKLLDFGCGFESHRRSLHDERRTQVESDTRKGALSQDRLSGSTNRLPIRGMTLANGHTVQPSHGGSWRSSGPSVLSSNAPPYPTPQKTERVHSRQNRKSEPYVDQYRSARQQRSPTMTSEPASPQQQAASQRSSSNSNPNAIAVHLQIPKSINSSKGSLPEFAAQVGRYQAESKIK